ncbi:TfuA domain-containing protein [Streptomyces sp. Ru73]|uniref:TfuA domain-containing protein n=1 Tax=Streptomyces sp. Ru73 TaxID=2080748 RepID=UPI0011B05B1B|nr:TfuA domain-containing protein [Streptomyces sp. Ru73]
MTIHVFVGPTVPVDVVRDRLPAAVVHGPAGHGDLIRLDPAPGDIAVVIDGRYHHSLPLRHKEILWALARGTVVLGAASIGALRAAELQAYGMVGVGEIFHQYRDGVIDSDADVAVAQTEDPPHRALTLALVDVRHQVTELTRSGVLTGEAAARILEVADALPYTARSWAAIKHHLARTRPELLAQTEEAARTVAGDPLLYSLKASDALRCLDHAGALTGAAPAAESWAADDGWRTTFLDEAIAEYLPADPGGAHPSTLGDVLREQRLHDPGFPARWAAYVRNWIATAKDTCPGRLTKEQTAEWLTPQEAHAWNYDRARTVAHVRSAAPPLARAAEADRLRALLHGRSPAVQECPPSTHTSRPAQGQRMRAYLSGVWGVPEENDALLAAARDRGFPSIRHAVDAARQLLNDPPLEERTTR